MRMLNLKYFVVSVCDENWVIFSNIYLPLLILLALSLTVVNEERNYSNFKVNGTCLSPLVADQRFIVIIVNSERNVSV